MLITWGRTEESKSEPRSVDAHQLTIEGQAWPGEGFPYGRLPARMQGQVRPELWQMGQYAAGLSVRFISNSAGLGAAWDQVGTEENAYNLTGIAQSGMDLYVREGDEWMWIGQAVPTAGINQAPVLVEGLDGQFRQYRLYLPLFSQVENLKIWVHKGEIGKMPPRVPDARRAPIVFYGRRPARRRLFAIRYLKAVAFGIGAVTEGQFIDAI